MSPDISLGNWLRQRALRSPNRRAITFEGSDAHVRRSCRSGSTASPTVLRDGGIRAGDRVGYLGFNHPAFLETMFAAARLGAIFVPLNFRLTGPELEFIINDAGCHTMVADSNHLAVLDTIRDDVSVPSLAERRDAIRPTDGTTTPPRSTRPTTDRRHTARRRRCGGGDHVHVRHHRAAEGGDAHPRQLLVEQRQRAPTRSTSSRTTCRSCSPRCSTSAV